MFETLTPPAPDKIIELMSLFRDDPRPGKIDLGVGVYKTPDGLTPVMKAVKLAEQQIWQAQDTKTYVGLAGDPGFIAAMRSLILGESVPSARVAGVATPGGTGALRQVFELIRKVTPEATVWISDPGWPNHAAIIDHLGLARRSYRYLDRATGALDRAGMMADLAEAKPGDLILLHGCCHNPSGADLTRDDWQAVAALCERSGAIPFVDIAYQGFGEGIEEDTAGTRILARHLPEMFVAASCSKNFGLYRERVGVVLAITAEGAPQQAAAGLLSSMNRLNYSFPPDHGARVVETILTDPALRQSWEDELAEMRETLTQNRKALADALRAETGSDRFGFLAGHQGMFSLCGATPDQVATLRNDHAIYMVGDGRINIAGLTPDSIPILARAMAETLR